MSRHQEWKMIHLLYQYARRRGRGSRRVLTEQELTDAGVWCDPDSWQVLEDAGVVRRVGRAYELSNAARKIVGTFTVAKGPVVNLDIRVDYPQVFVVMPFNQIWSERVFHELFEPSIEAAGFEVVRGDMSIRVGDLGTNVWRSITQAGLVVADLTAPNPNVYYELGLADMLGKPVLPFKQKGAKLPADVSGLHFYEYSLKNLPTARASLKRNLQKLANDRDNQYFGVKALADSFTRR